MYILIKNMTSNKKLKAQKIIDKWFLSVIIITGVKYNEKYEVKHGNDQAGTN